MKRVYDLVVRETRAHKLTARGLGQMQKAGADPRRFPPFYGNRSDFS